MSPADLLTLAAGNMRRMKLRMVLTVGGVMTAIAAFVAMLSFGAGIQESLTEEFQRFGLLATVVVYVNSEETTEADRPVLNDKAVVALGEIPGVALAFPFDALDVTAAIGDTQFVTQARPLTATAIQTKLFSDIVEGAAFASDSAAEAMVTTRFLELAGLDSTQTMVGQRIVLTSQVASLDSGLAQTIRGWTQDMKQRRHEPWLDSLDDRGFVERTIRQEVQSGMRHFLHGYMTARAHVSETLIVCGVLRHRQSGWFQTQPVLVPTATAARLNPGGLMGDPVSLFASLRSGAFFAEDEPGGSRSYTSVTLTLDPEARPEQVRDSVKARGYSCFSFADAFQEMRRFIFYFNLAMGAIGFVALVTASLGIINTMVMSIVERRREIGVLKSLGADERCIRTLFMMESAAIGLLGAVLGIGLGWVITRVASIVAMAIMRHEGLEAIPLFVTPLWLVATALAFGVGVATVAGLWPACRAAHVDPVEALRND